MSSVSASLFSYIAFMIENSFLIAFIILAWHSFSWDGQIFSGIKKVIKPEWKISKPIYGCPICATPWYGTIIYLLFMGSDPIEWFITVGAATGVNVISVILITIKDGLK